MDAIDVNVNIADIFHLMHSIYRHDSYYLVWHRAGQLESPVVRPPFDYGWFPNYLSTAGCQQANYHYY